MGIGTSLGAYFESPFHQEAGIDTPPDIVKPKDTGDDNVLPPDSESQTKSAAPQPVADIKTSNPLITITDEDIEKGINLGLSFSGGGLSLKKGAPLPEPMGEGPDVFQQFMTSRGNRQPSNIVDRSGDAAPANLRDIHPDHMSDEQFLRWGEYQPYGENNPMTTAQSDRWHVLAAAERDRPYTGTEADLYQHPIDEAYESDHATYGKRALEEAKRDFEERPDDVISKGKISLLKRATYNDGNTHQFNFMNAEGNIGELSIRELQGGKELYVPWMGTVAGNGANTIGRTEVRDLLNIVKEQFPKAETITGFRVSGARNATGRIGNASMRLRPATAE